MDVIVADRIAFVLGYDNDGKPTELQIIGSPTRTIFVRPNEVVIVANTHPVSGEQSITEFFKDKFYAWNYVPKTTAQAQDSEPHQHAVNAQKD